MQEQQIPESVWSWDDEVRVWRVTVASGHLHRAGAVPMDSCRRWQQSKLVRAGNGKLPRQVNGMAIDFNSNQDKFTYRVKKYASAAKYVTFVKVVLHI